MSGRVDASGLTWIRGAEVFSPQARGRMDVAICEGVVVAMGELAGLAEGWPGAVTGIDAEGMMLVPGFVDQHIHVSGGGGSAGPASKVPPLEVSALLEAGITSVVGCIGYDVIGDSPTGLLQQVRRLAASGFGAAMYTGAIPHPPPTITGEVSRDLALVPECVGAKIALREPMSAAGIRELRELAVGVALGARAAGKRGRVHVHIGRGSTPLDSLVTALESGDVDGTAITFTHANRSEEVLELAPRLAAAGAVVDVTATMTPELQAGSVEPASAVHRLWDAGVPIDRVTMSSDGNGAHPALDDDGALLSLVLHAPSMLTAAWRRLAMRPGVAFEQALVPVTSAAAASCDSTRGAVRPGSVADLLLLDSRLEIREMFVAGHRPATPDRDPV